MVNNWDWLMIIRRGWWWLVKINNGERGSTLVSYCRGVWPIAGFRYNCGWRHVPETNYNFQNTRWWFVRLVKRIVTWIHSILFELLVVLGWLLLPMARAVGAPSFSQRIWLVMLQICSYHALFDDWLAITAHHTCMPTNIHMRSHCFIQRCVLNICIYSIHHWHVETGYGRWVRNVCKVKAYPVCT